MLNKTAPTITITVTPLEQWSLDDLKSEWVQLFAKSERRIFLSWGWISSWLAVLPTNTPLYVVKGTYNDDTVAIAVFGECSIRRHGFIKSTQWHLHRTGNDALDQIWIEYNDLLTQNSDNVISSQHIRSQIWSYLTHQKLADEFVIDVAHKPTVFPSLPNAPDYRIVCSDQNGYVLPLTKTMSSYPKAISSSTSKQIIKTSKILHSLGLLTEEVIDDPAAIMAALEVSKNWHIKKWQQTNTPSGFGNPYFEHFHSSLITKETTRAVVIKLDGQIIGVNYLLVDDRHVYFYLSCIKPFKDNKIKIGLLLHKISVEWAAEHGYDYYDFLAGETSYKKKLTTEWVQFSKVILQNKAIRFRIETILKRVKAALIRNNNKQ